MGGKPYTLREKEIISHVYNYFKANSPLENKACLIRKTAKAKSDNGKGHKSPSRQKPNRKDAFNKPDDFDQEAVRRATHSFYNRNESPTLAKLSKTKAGFQLSIWEDMIG